MAVSSEGKPAEAAAQWREILKQRPGDLDAQQALAESENLKGAILESSLDGLITIDHLGNIVEFNPAAAAMFGIARGQALGKSMAEMIIPPRLRDAHHRGVAHLAPLAIAHLSARRRQLELLDEVVGALAHVVVARHHLELIEAADQQEERAGDRHLRPGEAARRRVRALGARGQA